MIIERDFSQHDQEWHDARLKSVGGTGIKKILTSKGVMSKSYDDYAIDMASRIITGKKKQIYPTYEMKWGTEHEQEARELFCFMHDIEMEEVAMIFNDDMKNWHISPDGINEKLKVGLEIKCPQLKEHLKCVADNKLPTKHILQVQSSLALTGWDVWYFMSYFPNVKPLIIKVERDNDLIPIICREVEIFNSAVLDLTENHKVK